MIEREPGDQAIELALWFDLSPVRPWEWPNIDASEWTNAIQVRAAFASGEADVREEAAMTRRLADMDAVA